ncbi:hypothetical protein BOTNAR_0198g00020 [Botryotinia narcissicola]|uniref:Uncharacterized protein n=1 Tax=Botryotinia narcissicola TaxID=278944 RepID=A0A4Z1I8E2_9HELO|nr:hypothetical protein BOTNAR_0198g00020 [Botryotinia narcissicola]
MNAVVEIESYTIIQGHLADHMRQIVQQQQQQPERILILNAEINCHKFLDQRPFNFSKDGTNGTCYERIEVAIAYLLVAPIISGMGRIELILLGSLYYANEYFSGKASLVDELYELSELEDHEKLGGIRAMIEKHSIMPRKAKQVVQSKTKEDILGDSSEYVCIDWLEGKEKEIVNPKVPGSFEKAVVYVECGYNQWRIY